MKTKLTNSKNSVPLCELSGALSLSKCASVLKKIRITLLTLVFSFLAFSGSWGQTLEWAKGLGSNISFNYFESNSMTVDNYGNVYVVGYNNGVFILKLDRFGHFVWEKSISGAYGKHIAVDSLCNIYFAGYFYGTVDFDPGVNTFSLSSVGSSDIFISKLDAFGNFQWARQIAGASEDYIDYMAVDASGNVYTAGTFYGSVDFDPGVEIFNLNSANGWYFIYKLNALGNFLWARQISAGDNFVNSIAVDNDENLYCTGWFQGTVDCDPGASTFNLISNGYDDIHITKLDSQGNFRWAKQIGGWSFDRGFSICLDGLNNLYITGNFADTVDFNPGTDTLNLISTGSDDIFISKLDSSANFLWAKQIGGIFYDCGYSISIDDEYNVYTTGQFSGTADFDPSPQNVFNLSTFGNNTESDTGDVFISKLNADGNFIWANRFGDYGNASDYGKEIKIDKNKNVYLLGVYNKNVDFNPGNETFYLNLTGYDKSFLLKLKQQGITGNIFNDLNQNCYSDSLEIGIQNRFVTINPGNIVAQTNESGIWAIDSLPIGTYTATFDTSGNWSPTCPVTQTFTVTNPNEITYVSDFGLISTQPCASPDISINMPFMRPCFSNQKVYVNACNQYIATGALNSAYTDIELDSLIIPQSASLAYTDLGNNVLRFQLDTLNPGHCVNFTIDCNVSCDAMLGQTLCMQANLFPADSCVFDTISEPYPGDFTPCTLPWDKSSLQVEGYCQNDSIYFVITNTGDFGGGDMDCFSPVRIYIDGTYTTLDSIKLIGGDSIVFVFAGDGSTWRLEADQHPLHPGNSHPNATVEACGNLANWTPDLVNILPPNDADPIVDIYCGLVTGSYDPNDKTGYPTGLAYNHYIMPNQQLQYVIRFQNTGTDTAFTVVVRDTLDMDLDIFSVVQGVASHTYNFQMYGPRVLEWTFYNIQLPDSNHNEAESHGFCTFTVNQNHDLANNTKITNSADIYFDYNAPITTNQTLHTVNYQVQTSVVTKVIAQGNKVSEIMIYPNPATNEVTIEIPNNKPQTTNNKQFKLFSIDGKKVLEGKLETTKTRISTKDLESGVYFIEVNVEGEKVNGKLVITK